MNGLRIAGALLLALGAGVCCAAENTLPPRGIAPPTRIPDPVPRMDQPRGEPLTSAELPREVRRAVAADAARKFGVAPAAVVLTRPERVTWGDGSLGCPRPGMAYTQALVPGFRVVAKTSSGELVYHTDSRGNVQSCASPPPPRPARAKSLSDAHNQTSPPPRESPDR